MKRDINIIKQILFDAESDKYPFGTIVEFDDIPSHVCAYHVALMQDEGLVIAKLIESSDYPVAAAIIIRLTSAGHNFCDGLRHDTIWNKVKDQVIDYGLSVCVEWVKYEVRQRVFGVPPNR